ncbi:AraC family transcriptional regulator [Pedobacter roseus]|uniref:Helix-turn-helix transcriptional regulator n=1 Tax=Pedobacter roseus TaxID=336820 RepID=A0A7G9QN44_9SPHI|nr:AraC family transcriptional regulator [Pedobacter roseus]QNN44769.1 helix-turn-helix transcriptional regulator [Pedobacter roseus]
MNESMASSCHYQPTISAEQFIPEHIFIYIVAGSISFYDGNKEYHLKNGDYCFAKRNSLARYFKKGPEGGEFKTVSTFLNQDFLKAFQKEYGYHEEVSSINSAIIPLEPNLLFANYVQSVSPYIQSTDTESIELMFLKKKELVLLLLKTNPELRNVIFDFSEPGKIDLESFMNRNFKFNVSIERFAYLTGRSISGFKRDFEKTFKEAPRRWLIQKRLQEAHFLIQKKKQKPTEVYLQVGFEDLSHFSFAFKKAFGMAPSVLLHSQ